MTAVPASNAPAEPSGEGSAPRAPAARSAGARAQVQLAHAAARQRLAAVRTRRDLLRGGGRGP